MGDALEQALIGPVGQRLGVPRLVFSFRHGAVASSALHGDGFALGTASFPTAREGNSAVGGYRACNHQPTRVERP